jgi:hypothetical protein
MKRYSWIAGAAVVVAALLPSAGSAQTQSDRWFALVGCWHAEGDEAANVLCVVPEGAGVRMVSLANGAVRSESRIVADGRARPVNQEGCQGTERADWSADGTRLFVHTDQTCGAGLNRKVSGIIAFTTPSRWVSVQAVTSGTNQSGARVVQYTAVEPTNLPPDIAQSFRGNRLARETARVAVSARLDLSDVREAAGKVDPIVVENWLTVTGQTFDLDAKKLVALADAGVTPAVLDALIAVSNPDHFDIKGVTAEVIEDGAIRRDARDRYGYGCDNSLWWGFDYSAYGYCNRHNRYGYYGYNPYGYDYYNWQLINRPIIIVKGSDDDVVNPLRPRATRSGYSSGRTNDSGSSAGRSTAGSSSSGGSTSSTSSSSGSSSSSSSSSSATRTAKPKGS